jgi:hypothetical protein
VLHALPHAPQLAGSALSSVHVPLQSVATIGHEATQRPMMQACVPVHALPHAPQLAGSWRSETHAPAHRTEPAGQTQTPLAQP